MIWRWYEDGIRWDRAGRGNINIVGTFLVARQFVEFVIDESSLIIKDIILLIITITKYSASLKCGQFAMLSNIFSIYIYNVRSGIMKSTNQTNLITVDDKDRQSHKTELLVCSCRGKGNKLCKVSYPVSSIVDIVTIIRQEAGNSSQCYITGPCHPDTLSRTGHTFVTLSL